MRKQTRRERTASDAPLSSATVDVGLIERAINGVEPPDYAGVSDSGTPAAPPITLSARP
jgi:hypothetical protein